MKLKSPHKIADLVVNLLETGQLAQSHHNMLSYWRWFFSEKKFWMSL